jgi:hypothetical protein
MEARQEAEYDRLARAWRNGPGRRMIQDAKMGRGRGLSRADLEQSDRYRREMEAVALGRT